MKKIMIVMSVFLFLTSHAFADSGSKNLEEYLMTPTELQLKKNYQAALVRDSIAYKSEIEKYGQEKFFWGMGVGGASGIILGVLVTFATLAWLKQKKEAKENQKNKVIPLHSSVAPV